MAKEQKGKGVEEATGAATDPAAPAAPKEKKARKERAPMNCNYVILKTDKTDAALKELPKQAQLIAGIILEAGDAGIGRDALLAKAKDVVTTVQPIARIVDYYKKLLAEKLGMVVNKIAA